MDFMLIMLWDREGSGFAPAVFAEMGEFAGGLAQAGKLKGGSPLKPEAEGARVRGAGDAAVVTDGPFTETKEIVGGYFLVSCESREEAIALARRSPHARVGPVEVREVIPVGGPPSG